MQLEGNFPEPEELPSGGLLRRAGLRPAAPRSLSRHPEERSVASDEGSRDFRDIGVIATHSPSPGGRGQGEGLPSSPRAPGVVAVSPASSPSRISVGAGLAPAPLSPASPVTPVILRSGAQRATEPSTKGRPSAVGNASRERGVYDPLIDQPSPNHATLHSSSPSLPAVDPVPFLPDDVGAGLAPARSVTADGSVGAGLAPARSSSPAQDSVQDTCTLVQGSLVGVLR